MRSAFLLTGTFPATFQLYLRSLSVFIQLFNPGFSRTAVVNAERANCDSVLTCLSFTFFGIAVWFAKPLRIQTKDKNNGLSDYSHTDLHYLKSFSQLGCLQQEHPSPTKIPSWRVNTGAWAGSIREMDR